MLSESSASRQGQPGSRASSLLQENACALFVGPRGRLVLAREQLSTARATAYSGSSFNCRNRLSVREKSSAAPPAANSSSDTVANNCSLNCRS